MNYTVYHLHDDTSNCNGYADSCTSYKEYIKLAKKQGMRAIAFSNHGGIYDWIKKKQDCDKAGLKYIHGVELYLCSKLEDDIRGYHIGLYARNFDGVKELNSLISISTSKGESDDNKSNRHAYHNPRISLEELMNTSDNIIISSACLASILWSCHYTKKIENMTNEEIESETKAWIVARKKILEWMSKNKHRCFLEIQYHNCEHQIEYNKMLYSWSLEYGIPLIAGTDTHSSTKYKSECRSILQKSKDSYYGEEDEFDLTWKSYDELVNEFQVQNALPKEVYLEAIKNTNVFADKIENFSLDYNFKYPTLYGDTALIQWKELIKNKLKEKIDRNEISKDKLSEYKKRINEEIRAMSKQGMESFMLFMAELVDYCIKNNIPYGDCRGSVGGSTIAYITDITDVDPIVWNTVFSRFCNEDRISLADIDIDFAPEDRVKVYKYIINRFTPQKTAFIAQFGTLKDRGTIDVLAKGLGYEDLDVVKDIKNQFDDIFNSYSKIIQEEVNLEEMEDSSIDFDYHDIYCERIRNQSAIIKINKIKASFEELKKNNKDLFFYFDGLKGTIVSKGNHPAGIIGSPITLPDNLGVWYKKGDLNNPVSFCAMKAVDSVNYVKFDILGLKTVGIIKDAYEYIGKQWERSYQIDWEDEKVWNDMIKSRAGVFQFEGDYAFDLLKQFEPTKINHMSIVNAALRPSGKSYRDRLIAKEFNQNPSKQIDELLKDNNGYLVFQEDTIKFLTDICGFSGGLADTTRRAIGKKDTELLNEQLPKILEGYCSKSDKSRDVAEEEAKQFLQIIDDSSEYQFGYNHSTGYSKVGYRSARLRAYYGIEFAAAYLNRIEDAVHMGIGIELLNHLNIELKGIEFGKSKARYTPNKEENAIYKGIHSIKWCNAQIADELYNLSKTKSYTNFLELIADIKKTSIDTRQLKILTGLNFFKAFGNNKRLLKIIQLYEDFAERKQINFKDIQKLEINEDMLKRYCGKTTATLYKELDMIGYLSEFCQSIEDKPLSAKEQMEFEMKYLEYITYTNEKASDEFYAVIEFKTYQDKCKPYVMLRQINSGVEFKSKVTSKKVFQEHAFELFSILKINQFREQQKTKMINGEWVKTDELEKILVDWEVY